MKHAGLEPLLYRLRCMHKALAALQPRDASSVPRDIKETDCIASIHIDYSSGKDDMAILSDYEQLFNNINHLRDAVKNWAQSHGKDKIKVEELVTHNRELGICVDISNGLKHVELNNKGRTGLKPSIGSVSSGLKLPVGQTPVPIPGLSIRIDEHGKPRVSDGISQSHGILVIEAEIIDKEGNRIGNALEIAKKAIEIWERFLSDWGIKLPTEKQ